MANGKVRKQSPPKQAPPKQAPPKQAPPKQTKIKLSCAEQLKKARKERYAGNGSKGRHCGDWLAKTLGELFLDGKKFDIEGFTDCLKENEVNMTGKWADLPNSGQNGWQGRYRMNGRLKLEERVLQQGNLVCHGESYTAPEAWRQEVIKRHPDWQ